MAANPLATFYKDPNAVLDYSFDWSDWLRGDVITASTWAAPAGITVDSSTFAGSLTTAWISGGVDGTSYDIVNHITTLAGRAEDRTIRIVAVSR